MKHYIEFVGALQNSVLWLVEVLEQLRSREKRSQSFKKEVTTEESRNP